MPPGRLRPAFIASIDIAKILSWLLIISGFSGILIPIFIGMPELAILGAYLGIPMILSGIIFFFTAENQPWLKCISGDSFAVFPILFVFLFSASIVLLHANSVRPTLYFIIISISYTVVLLEIVLFELSRTKSLVILSQVILIVLNIVWGVNYNYYLFIGHTDLLGHGWLIQNLIQNGFVSNIFGQYTDFPLYHIQTAISSLITSFPQDIYKLMSLINGITYSFIIIFSYIVGSKIFKNDKIALLSALFVSVNQSFLWFGMSTIARSVINFFVLVLLLLLVQRKSIEFTVLTFLVTLSIIIYHPASMPFIALILIIMVSIQFLSNRNTSSSIISFPSLALILTMTIAYWLFRSVFIVKIMLSNIIRENPEEAMNKLGQIATPINEVFNYLHYSPLLLFVLLGALFVLREKRMGNLVKAFCLTGLVLTVFAFPGPSLLIDKLASDLQIGRFGEYAFLFLSIAAAVGMFLLYSRTRRIGHVVIILLFASMCLLSISNEFVASDNPLVKRPFYTFYFTEEETRGIDHLSNMTTGYVMTDYVTGRYITFSKFNEKSQILETNPNATMLLRNSTDDVFLIRQGELIRRPLKISTAPSDDFLLDPQEYMLKYTYGDSPIWSLARRYSKIYDSKEIVALN